MRSQHAAAAWPRRQLTRRSFTRAAFIGAGGAAAFAVACGSSGNKPKASGSATGAAVVPTAAGTPKSGGHLNLMLAADPPHLDELQITSFTTSTVWGLVYNGLLQFKLGPGIDASVFDVEPDIAKSFENPDPLTYTFHLNSGVTFQDLPPVNGRAVTSADIKYSLQRLATNTPGYTHSYMVDTVTAIDTPDDATVTLKLSKPFPPLLTYLASLYASIQPHEVIEQDGDLKKTAIGTGPFVLKDWQRNVKLEFEKNPHYFHSGQPYLDGVTIFIIPTVADQQAAFRIQRIDIVQASDPATAKTIEQQNPNSKKLTSLTRNGFGWRFRIDQPPFNDKRVRQAIVEGHNKKGEIEAAYGGFGEETGPLSVAFPPYAKTIQQLGAPWVFNLDDAKKRFAAAGVQSGTSTTVVLTSSGHGQVEANAGAYYVQNLKALGFNPTINDMQYAQFLDELYKGDYPIQRVGWPAAHDIDEWFTTFFNYAEAGAHDQQWDPQLIQLLDAEAHAPDKDSRTKAIDALQSHLADTCYIDMELIQKQEMLWQPYVMNFSPNGLGVYGWGSQVLRTVWLDKR
jgi:peptide/nickel transport system substrate-binding protein